MPFNTANILDRIWRKCLTDKGVTIQLRPEDNLKLLVTRLRRRHTALKKHYGEEPTGKALQLFHIRVNEDLHQLHLEYVDIPQSTLSYLVTVLDLNPIYTEYPLNDLHISGVKVFALNGV